MTVVNTKPYDYLGYSILSTLFCCCCAGLVALYCSILVSCVLLQLLLNYYDYVLLQVNTEYSAGRVENATFASKIGRNFNYIAAVLGILGWISFIYSLKISQ